MNTGPLSMERPVFPHFPSGKLVTCGHWAGVLCAQTTALCVPGFCVNRFLMTHVKGLCAGMPGSKR